MKDPRTPAQWAEVCKSITSGYAPGGKHSRPHLYEFGVAYVRDVLKPLGLWKPGDLIVDIGCANGMVAMGLVEEGIRYVGLEVNARCIEFAKAAFAPYRAFHFYHIDVLNTRYNKTGVIPPDRVIFPVVGATADFMLAKSLFSHLQIERIAVHYLAEIARILKPGGLALTTWLRDPPLRHTTEAAHTVYLESFIRQAIGRHFDIVKEWGGDTQSLKAQWHIIGRKRA